MITDDITITFKRQNFIEMIHTASKRMREMAIVKWDAQWVPHLHEDRMVCLIPYLYKYVLTEEFRPLHPFKEDSPSSLLDDSPSFGKCYGVEIFTLSPNDKVHFVDKRGGYPSVSFNVRNYE